jgi:hypothetical protein
MRPLGVESFFISPAIAMLEPSLRRARGVGVVPEQLEVIPD